MMAAKVKGATEGLNAAAAWAALHDDPAFAGRGFVFRRSVELACEACRVWARPGQTWIDAGTGCGHLARTLAALGPRVIAVDSDPAMLSWAQRCEPEAGMGRNAPEFIRGSVAQLPLADSCVDGVVGASLAGCLSGLEAFLLESHRVLRSGGRLVLTATNTASLLLRVNNVLRRMGSGRVKSDTEHHQYRLYHTHEVMAALHNAGFQPVGLRFFNFVLNAGPWLLPTAAVAVRFDRDAVPSDGASRVARNFLVTAQRT